jgi:hypothetical protein
MENIMKRPVYNVRWTVSALSCLRDWTRVNFQRSGFVSLLKARAWNLCRAKVQSATSHLPFSVYIS